MIRFLFTKMRFSASTKLVELVLQPSRQTSKRECVSVCNKYKASPEGMSLFVFFKVLLNFFYIFYSLKEIQIEMLETLHWFEWGISALMLLCSVRFWCDGWFVGAGVRVFVCTYHIRFRWYPLTEFPIHMWYLFDVYCCIDLRPIGKKWRNVRDFWL